MTTDHEATFASLREVLLAHASGLTVATDTAWRVCLEARPGSATIASWRGEVRRPTIQVAWVERGASYVGYHLMGLQGMPALVAGLSPELQARKHGKTCFNFRHTEPSLLAELGAITVASIEGMRRAGFLEADAGSGPMV